MNPLWVFGLRSIGNVPVSIPEWVSIDASCKLPRQKRRDLRDSIRNFPHRKYLSLTPRIYLHGHRNQPLDRDRNVSNMGDLVLPGTASTRGSDIDASRRSRTIRNRQINPRNECGSSYCSANESDGRGGGLHYWSNRMKDNRMEPTAR